jgi:predicted acetylornithine/succinylornithine family transaminase
MSNALLPVYERDLVLVSGKGARVTDSSGGSYLDFAAGIGVSGLGHGDAKVVAAIRRQAGRLMHVSNLYHSEPATHLAERLVALAFPSKVFFCNSGTEAVEGAIKFARRIGRPHGRHELVAFERGFSGRSMGALSLTWSPKYREPFEPLVPGVRFLPWSDLDAADKTIGPTTAAVFVEPVQGEGGVRPAPPEFLQGLKKLCEECGALLVADEVQCGLGRTGRLFAYEHAGIVPDILTLAKPLGGGLPMGAILLREELCDALHPGDHGSTFGGNPVCAAAALAVLDRLTSPGFVEGVARKGATLVRGLRKLARRYPAAIAEVRGLGLMVGVEFKGESGPVVKGLRERGVLATRAGDHVLRLLPPLVVRPADLRAFLEALDAVLTTGAGRPSAVAPPVEAGRHG